MSRRDLIERLKLRKQIVEPDQDFVVELFKKEDALGVSLAYLEIYGESFPIEHVYNPEEVAKRNETKDQYTVVARTSKGDIVGLGGLFRHAPNNDVYEAGQLMVFKSYRNGEIAKKISFLLLSELPEQLGIKVIFAEAVCNHPVSQQLAYGKGLLPTAISIECMPSQAYTSEGDVKRNVSLLLMFVVNKDRHHEVFLPALYSDAIKEIFERLGLSRSEGTGSILSGESVFEDFLIPDAKFSRITVEKPGVDFTAVINDFEQKAGTDGLIQIYMNIGHSSAPEAITMLRDRGYMFGGVLPLWFGSDGIIMQRLASEPDWKAIRLRHKESRKLLEYLRADYDSVTHSTY